MSGASIHRDAEKEGVLERGHSRKTTHPESLGLAIIGNTVPRADHNLLAEALSPEGS